MLTANRCGAAAALLLVLTACQPVQLPAPMPGETINDVLLPGGKPVGAADEATRLLPGGPQEARALFLRLSQGGVSATPPGYPGEVRRMADGRTIGFLVTPDGNLATVVVEVLVPGKGAVIRQISFSPTLKKDGGGAM
jgi:hypothetical protein